MTQQEKEYKISYYLYKKGAKPNSSVFIPTEKVAHQTKIPLSEVQEIFQTSKYFQFNNANIVGLILTKEGIDFVENKNKRFIENSIKWGTFIAAIISAILGIVQFFMK